MRNHKSKLCCSIKGEECIPQTWDMFHEKYVPLMYTDIDDPPDMVKDGAFWSFSGISRVYRL